MLYVCQKIVSSNCSSHWSVWFSSVYCCSCRTNEKQITDYNRSVLFWHFGSVTASRRTELLYDSEMSLLSQKPKTIWLVENMYE